MSLRISQRELEAIREHGRQQYPRECCGLLLGETNGSVKIVESIRRASNTREDSPENRYLIAPSELLEAEKEARIRGWDILGVYHSHPDHPASPSQYDVEHAIPWYSYIILKVHNGEAAELTCWTLREDRSSFELEEIDTRH